MNYKKQLLIVLTLATIVGCRSITVDKTKMHAATTGPVAPGVLGIQEDKLQSSNFQVTAIPEYKKPIRLGVTALAFNKTTYQTYLKASKANNAQGIKYVDSVETKPKFLKLEILDQVTTLSEIQEEHNMQTTAYIKNQRKACIVTTVSAAYPVAVIDEIMAAEAVFLVNDNYKQYNLSLVKDGKPYKTIALSTATIFGYRLSFFCWGENDKNQISIFDMMDEAKACPKNTYRSARKAKEKNNYLKL